MLTLSGYDNTSGDAYLIHNPNGPSYVKVMSVGGVDVTAYLKEKNILVSEGTDPPSGESYVETLFGDDFAQVALVAMDIPIPVEEAGRLG